MASMAHMRTYNCYILQIHVHGNYVPGTGRFFALTIDYFVSGPVFDIIKSCHHFVSHLTMVIC